MDEAAYTPPKAARLVVATYGGPLQPGALSLAAARRKRSRITAKIWFDALRAHADEEEANAAATRVAGSASAAQYYARRDIWAPELLPRRAASRGPAGPYYARCPSGIFCNLNAYRMQYLHALAAWATGGPKLPGPMTAEDRKLIAATLTQLLTAHVEIRCWAPEVGLVRLDDTIGYGYVRPFAFALPASSYDVENCVGYSTLYSGKGKSTAASKPHRHIMPAEAARTRELGRHWARRMNYWTQTSIAQYAETAPKLPIVVTGAGSMLSVLRDDLKAAQKHTAVILCRTGQEKIKLGALESAVLPKHPLSQAHYRTRLSQVRRGLIYNQEPALAHVLWLLFGGRFSWVQHIVTTRPGLQLRPLSGFEVEDSQQLEHVPLSSITQRRRQQL